MRLSLRKKSLPGQKYVLLYDATCRFCDATSKRAIAVVPEGTIERVDINDPTIQARYGITVEAAQRSVHLVGPDGSVRHSGGAVREILSLSRWFWPLALLWYIPGFSWLAERVYAWVADHRYLFMGKMTPQAAAQAAGCDDGACAVHLGVKKKAEVGTQKSEV